MYHVLGESGGIFSVKGFWEQLRTSRMTLKIKCNCAKLRLNFSNGCDMKVSFLKILYGFYFYFVT